MKRMRTLFPVLALLAAACAAPEPEPPAAAAPEPLSFSEVAARAKPAVVNVSARQRVDPDDPASLLAPLPPEGGLGLDSLPLPGSDDPVRRRSLGSGFFISSDGLVLTNHHVIADAEKILVRLPSREPAIGHEYPARLVGSDVRTDVALLKIDTGSKRMPSLRLGDSSRVRVGDWVVAVGNPFGLEQTVTAGIVSATGRAIGTEEGDFIQTDAPINPGSSGGPLLNLEGEVVGINNVILSQTGGNLGIGFATPAAIVSPVLESLRRQGHVVRGWLGVSGQEITPELAEAFSLSGQSGALVSHVERGGPGEDVGLRPGDVIVSFQGRPVPNARDLSRRIADARPGQPVTLEIVRDGARRKLEVAIAEAPRDRGRENDRGKAPPEIDFGLVVEPLTPKIAKELGLPEGPGVLVRDVLPGGLGEEAGLSPGDVIVEVNRRPVNSVESLRREVLRAPKDKSVLFFVRRERETIFLAVRKG